MGHEERARAVQSMQRQAAMERMLGDPVPFGTHDLGCPKCAVPVLGLAAAIPTGMVPGHKRNYCFGAQKLIDDAPCKIPGEHFHVQCQGCGHVWLERCRDWKPEDAPSALAP